MLRDNVLVRKLVGIETAGSLNLLFTDKTGTITKGKLEVVRFITGDRQEYPAFDVLPAKLKAFTYQTLCSIPRQPFLTALWSAAI